MRACTVLVCALLPAAAFGQAGAWRLRPVERLRNPLVGRADLGGFVFDDRNGNGRFDRDEPGLPRAVIALDDGRWAVTDAGGRWQMSEVAPGQRALSLRASSLPPAARPLRATEVVEAPPGSFTRVDFAVDIDTITIKTGEPEVLGYKVFPTVEEAAINVVGNTTDQQALANGRRIEFPEADVLLGGFGRGNYVAAGSFRRAAFKLSTRSVEAPTAWELQLVDPEGRVLRTHSGEGAPQRRVDFDGTGEDGRPLAAPGAYAVRLCVDFGAHTRACSPHRTFGIVAGSGRSAARPALETPPRTAGARVNGAAAAIDADGSFILPSRPDGQRQLRVELQRADGREASTVVTIPTLDLELPDGPFGVSWKGETRRYRAPPEPGSITLFVKGRVSEGAKVLLGTKAVETEDGAFSTTLPLPLGETRTEFTVTDARGFNTLYDFRLRFGDRTPEGQPIVLQPRVPALEITVPTETDSRGAHRVPLRGRTEVGATLTANDQPVEVGPDGRFDAEVAIDPKDPRLRVVVTDAEGRTGRVERRWLGGKGGAELGVFADGEPFVRLIHSEVASGESSTRRGFAGGLSASAQRIRTRGTSVWSGVSAGAADRRPVPAGSSLPDDPWLRAALLAGLESRLGTSVVVGADLEGTVYLLGDEGVPMRHRAGMHAALLGSAFDVTLDLGGEYADSGADTNSILAGGGLGARWRAGRRFDVRARLGARLSLGDADGEVLDGAAQLTWHSAGGGVVSLRYAHLEDSRTIEPEAAGDVAHLVFGWPLGRSLRLSEAIGLWRVPGAITALSATRLELSVTDSLLVALDYRLQTQLDLFDHDLGLEADYRVNDWLRLGALYRLSKVTGGGEGSSRLQARAQVVF